MEETEEETEEEAELEVRELWGPDPSSLIYAAAACAEGDPLADRALLRAAADRGVQARDIEKRRAKVWTHPPGEGRPRTCTLRGDGVLYVKGEVEAVLPLCLGDVGDAPEVLARMRANGLRVIAVATGSSEREANLTLWGLVGLSPRR